MLFLNFVFLHNNDLCLSNQDKPVLHFHPLHAVQVQDGQDDGHEEDDDAADAHAYVEHLSGAGGGGDTVYWWTQATR